ncbi:MAG TPA: GNAT family N-acetyltransferase [Longimicrobiales bacterium]|nr:GNAT family N-acetyltransferase [Longimicrobiales bacterium]
MSETLHCRFAGDADVPDVARLVRHSFPSAIRTQESVEELLRAPRYGGGLETLLVGELDGRIAGALQLHPLQQWVGGVRLPMAGVGTVAISPAYRRRRLAEQLVATGLRAARERGDLVSALYPFRVGFYHRLGYGNAGVAEQWQIPARSLGDSPERVNVELLETEAGRNEAFEVYCAWARAQNGQLERSPAMWSGLVQQPGRALAGYRDDDGRLAGYALVTYRTDLPRRDRFLEVDEIVWTTPASRRALYAWLASLADQWDQLLIRTLPSHRMQDWVSEPRLPPDAAPSWQLWSPAATLMMGPMFRLVDVVRAWEQRTIVDTAKMSIALELDDAHLPENAGRWVLSLEAGGSTLARTGTAPATLRLGIATLSRLYIGALSATAAATAGLLDCDRPGLLPALDAALALQEPWLFDRF